MFIVLQLRAVDSGQAKAAISNRVVAKVLDLLIVMAASVIVPWPVGPLLGFLYSIFADGMSFGPFRGQSLGKKLVGLQVINRRTGRAASFRDSGFRNAPVGVATFFAIIPVWGWVILALVGMPLMAIEVYLMLRVETGHRLGDVMGDTEVIEVPKQA